MSITVKSEVSITSDCFPFGVSQSLWIKPKLLNIANKRLLIFIALASPASVLSPFPLPLWLKPGTTTRGCTQKPCFLPPLPHYESSESQLTFSRLQEASPRLDRGVPLLCDSPTQVPLHATSSLLTCFFPLHSKALEVGGWILFTSASLVLDIGPGTQ